MEVSENGRDVDLMPLLYVRSRWNLNPDIAVPVELSVPVHPTDVPAPMSVVELNDRWARDWQQFLDQRETKPVSNGRQEFFAQLRSWQQTLPKSWIDRFNDFWDEEGYDSWLAKTARRVVTVDLRRDLTPSLAAAWRAGLTQITVLPIAQPFAYRPHGRELIVSDATRNNMERMSDLLSEWWRGRIAT